MRCPTLQSSLGVQIHMLNINSLMNSVLANPSQYGLTNVTNAALLSGSNGTGYLFWDPYHPTTQVDAVIGEVAAQAVPAVNAAGPGHGVRDCGALARGAAKETTSPGIGGCGIPPSLSRVVRRFAATGATGDERLSLAGNGYLDHGLAIIPVTTSSEAMTAPRSKLTGATRIATGSDAVAATDPGRMLTAIVLSGIPRSRVGFPFGRIGVNPRLICESAISVIRASLSLVPTQRNE